ncbi:Beta-arrestin-1 [Dirofilaria immitis]|nr:Beta-arrestin-1 [Dirofilaria immitis]
MDERRSGTRVFKKTSPNGKITTYLGKRDFIDHGNFVDLIDGMVLIDEDYIRENRKITAYLLAAFRYGREDLDVLGVSSGHFASSTTNAITREIKKKLGTNAYPFWFQIPTHSASSVTLQPAQGDTGKPCGVDFELKTVVESLEGNNIDKPRKHNSVRLAIRKLTYAPYKNRPQPTIEVTKEFMMSSGLLHMEASLDKEMYYHGESIAVNVHIQNNSNKTVKKIKACIAQIADICLLLLHPIRVKLQRLNQRYEGFPVGPGATLSKVYTLCPLLSNNKDKRGLALDGQLKHEDTNLASSTSLSAETTKENLGIVVQYKVKVRLNISGPLGGELIAELPFTLTHPKPLENIEIRREQQKASSPPNNEELNVDLIQLDTLDYPRVEDEDIIFEDFARLRVRAANHSDDPFEPS